MIKNEAQYIYFPVLILISFRSVFCSIVICLILSFRNHVFLYSFKIL